jgi:hypothetical protein
MKIKTSGSETRQKVLDSEVGTCLGPELVNAL